MQAEKPWKLVKSTNEQEKARAYSVVSLCANISCLLALLVEPFMPHLAGVMLEQLNAKLEDVNVLAQTKEEDRLFRYFFLFLRLTLSVIHYAKIQCQISWGLLRAL